jgi:hypothetical protein
MCVSALTLHALIEGTLIKKVHCYLSRDKQPELNSKGNHPKMHAYVSILSPNGRTHFAAGTHNMYALPRNHTPGHTHIIKCVHTHTHIHTHTLSHTHAQAHTHTHAQAHTSSHTHIHTRAQAHTHIHTRIHARAHKNVEAVTHSHSHTCTSTYMLTSAHIQTHP